MEILVMFTVHWVTSMHKAIEHHKDQLKIAKEIGDRAGEGKAYGNLDNA